MNDRAPKLLIYAFTALCYLCGGRSFVLPNLVSVPASEDRRSDVSCAHLLHAKSRNSKRTADIQYGVQSKSIEIRDNVDVEDLLKCVGLQTANSSKVRRNCSQPKHQKSEAYKNKRKISKIDLQTQLQYSRNGHAVLRSLVTSDMCDLTTLRNPLIDYAKRQELEAWKQKVQVASNNDDKITNKCHSISDCQEALQNLGVTASLPFLQYFNTWRKIPEVRHLCFSLGQAASILMDVPTVRLYQDAIFWKRKGDGPTPWHVDARMAPFDTSHMITFWIPLQDIPRYGTALVFCSKSHVDMALPYWNPVNDVEKGKEWNRLEDRYPTKLVDYMPLRVGDVTVHSGWTLHCSKGNNERHTSCQKQERLALAISFVDGDAEIRPDWKLVGDDEDRWSYDTWCTEVTARTRFSHELVPIVWPYSD